MGDETKIRDRGAGSSQPPELGEDPLRASALEDEDTAAIVDEVAEAFAKAELIAEEARLQAEALRQEQILDAAVEAPGDDEGESANDAGILAGDLVEVEAATEVAAEVAAAEVDAADVDAAAEVDPAAEIEAAPGIDSDPDTLDEDDATALRAARPARGGADDADEEMARALSEEEPTAEEQALAQAADEVDPEADVVPAEIEEIDEDQGSLEKLAAKARRLNEDQARNALHSVLFVADKPLTVEHLRAATGLEPARIRDALERLGGELREGISGVVLSEVGGGWQLRTAPESADFVRRFLRVKPRRLTRAALETLAIVAYRQPVTRPEIEEIRGVDCGAVLKALLEWKLLKILGKKDEAGRPLLYGTSREFLEFFQIKDLGSLPSLREFHELNEESRQIVEEELGPDAVEGIAGTLAELADPAFLEAEQERAAKSEAALADLEQAMADAEQLATDVAENLAPSKKKSDPDEPDEVEAPA